MPKDIQNKLNSPVDTTNVILVLKLFAWFIAYILSNLFIVTAFLTEAPKNLIPNDTILKALYPVILLICLIIPSVIFRLLGSIKWAKALSYLLLVPSVLAVSFLIISPFIDMLTNCGGDCGDNMGLAFFILIIFGIFACLLLAFNIFLFFIYKKLLGMDKKIS